MSLTRFVPFLLLIFTSLKSVAQTDSALQLLQQVFEKYSIILHIKTAAQRDFVDSGDEVFYSKHIEFRKKPHTNLPEIFREAVENKQPAFNNLSLKLEYSAAIAGSLNVRDAEYFNNGYELINN